MHLTGAVLQQLLGGKAAPLLNKQAKFRLAKVSLIKAACPITIAASLENQSPLCPIVIAANDHDLGATAIGYLPASIMVAGAARRAELLKRCIVASWAWTQQELSDISADDAISSSELMSKLSSLVTRRVLGSVDCSIPSQQQPWLREVYPFENFSIYEYRGQQFRQGFQLDDSDRSIILAGASVPIGACNAKQFMPMSQTGRQYTPGWTPGNNQSVTMGAPNSELITNVVRNFDNINNAVDMYLDAVRNGLHTQMKPAFAPVNLTNDGKIASALAARGIEPMDFAIWSEKIQAGEKKKIGTGQKLGPESFAYVGDISKPDTWALPVHDAKHARLALGRVNQTDGIPAHAKAGVLGKIRRAAKKHGVDVSPKTSGQKKWQGASTQQKACYR